MKGQAYRLILGREPESEAVLAKHGDVENLSTLREGFFKSREFAEAVPHLSVGLHMNRSSDPIELQCTPGELQSMLDRIATAWKAFGEDEPFWSVLTHDDYKRGSIETRIDEFYAHGHDTVTTALAMLQRNRVPVGRYQHVIDFGCGVGRISLALTEKFDRVTGVDVSEPHLNLARAEAGKRGITNVEFVGVQSIEALDSLPTCDLLLTVIVLQHNPPPVIATTLRKLLGRVRPGGAALFQVPTFIANYSFSPKKYLAEDQPQMEMNALPQRDVFRIAAEAEFYPLEVREDVNAGDPNIVSQTFLFRRKS
jgi:SAM-dependent methyltransferase